MTAWRDRRFQLGVASLLLLLGSFVMPNLPVARPIYDVIAVLDITGSMNVRDQQIRGMPATRLAMEKSAARALLAALPCGSRLGIAIFAETRPFLLFEPAETCGNFAPLDAEIAAIDWRMAWDGESHIAIGLRNAMQEAGALGADVIFMTDGQEVPPLWWTGAPKFDALRGVTHGLLAGVGGLSLSPIPKFDYAGRQIGTWKPGEVPSETAGLFRGREHLSAVDEAHLQSLAAQSGLTYLRVANASDVMPAFVRAVPKRTRQGKLDLRFVAAGAALSLLAAAALTESFVGRAVRRSPGSVLGHHGSGAG